MRTVDLEPSQIYDFADAIGDRKLLRGGIGPDSDMILLTVAPEYLDIARGRTNRHGASFPHSLARQPYPATVIHSVDTDIVVSFDIAEVTAAHPHIQPLAGSRILIVAARCFYVDGAGEENATIYRADGQVERRMVFGDGINAVQVSRGQQIWVSYSDEGIFGNFGWREPIGRDGLLCFDTDGKIIWRFHPPDGSDQICDCYALNVANRAVWAYYYTDFPVVRIAGDKQIDMWTNELGGASAITTDGRRVLLWGGYNDRTRCVLQTISGDKLDSMTTINLILAEGDISQAQYVIGRDSVLHVLVGTVWYQFDVHHIPW